METTPRSAAVARRELPGPSVADSLRSTGRIRRDMTGWVVEQRQRHGDLFATPFPAWLPGAPPMIVYACEPVSVREILTDMDRFVKHAPVYDEMAAALGDGLLTSEGDKWRGQRRTLQPLFTRRRVADYTDAFLSAIAVVSDGWAGRPSVDLADEMEKVTLGSVSRALFGTDATADVAPIVAATDELSRIMLRRGLAPVRLPRWLPTPGNRRLGRMQWDLETRVAHIVADASADADGRDDLVARLLAARDPETGQALDRQEVLDQALVFLLAGYDTTSTALAFALHLLGQHQGVQATVRAELVAVVGDRVPTAHDAVQLDVTRRCLLEAMRLYPPAHTTGRLAARDTTLAGYAVPAGSVVAAVFAALHRNEHVWPDPERFDPDRFLPAAVRERDHYAYLPFGGGPRSCIGEHFALLEATLALAVLLRRWRITTDGATVPMRYGITQRAAAPVRATVEPV